MRSLLESLGFHQIGTVTDGRIIYQHDAQELAGSGNAVYLFLNTDDSVWKIGMTRKGFGRVDYTRVFDGRAMKRPNEQRKLALIREELGDGSTQWVLPTLDDPERLEDLFIVLFNPTESRRQRSKLEREIRHTLGI